ncbi:hypothetical protein GCM10022262_42960 [Georgenia daeguensis]|uniref:Uncharacterized protein n=1 Tax=Georgenia daeguensis TaxID=908355 RepID=A0ABP6UT05_9MICO
MPVFPSTLSVTFAGKCGVLSMPIGGLRLGGCGRAALADVRRPIPERDVCSLRGLSECARALFLTNARTVRGSQVL